MIRRLCFFSWATIFSIAAANAAPQMASNDALLFNRSTGFIRFSYDNMSMPDNIPHMGLIGINYFADITTHIYGGIGTYGSITGTQGGLFTLGAAGGYHREFAPHWWGDANLFVGGGGGRSSLVGGGLMIRPALGVAYALPWGRLGVHYSYIGFPDGRIHSQQIGLDLDLLTDFYYLSPRDRWVSLPKLSDFNLPLGKYIGFQRNDFAILLQSYHQEAGTLNTEHHIQDGTIHLVGAEVNHYITSNTFWWIKAAGAYSGIPNGYMDIIGGLGYHWQLGNTPFALVPQLGIGAGGGGMVDSGGGFLINPQLGVELPIISSFSFRLSSGYLWSPQGQLHVVPITGELLYHLNFATANNVSSNLISNDYSILGWRLQLLNQTYWHVQRTFTDMTSAINLVAVQLDQLFNPNFFMAYQGAFAYSGYHAGGYATGMIGPGIQSSSFYHDRLRIFGELLVGAGGGGSLALSGGAIIEPVVGVHFAITPVIGLQASYSQIKALDDKLNTPVLNAGLVVRFDTINQNTT